MTTPDLKRPTKAVLAVCAEIEGDGSRCSVEQTVYAAERIVELRKQVAIAAEILTWHEREHGSTSTGSQFLAFAKREAARTRRGAK